MKRYMLTIAALVLLTAAANGIAHPVLAQASGPYISGAASTLAGTVLSRTSSNPSSAEGTLVDFESLTASVDWSASGDWYVWVDSYSQNGFTLVDPTNSTDAFVSPEPLSNDYLGSTSLADARDGGISLLRRQDGGTFTAGSIDIAEIHPSDPTPRQVSFTGTRADGTKVNATYTTDGLAGFETFTFAGFTNLVSLSWVQAYPYHQFDNIVLNPTAPSPEGKSDCMQGGWARFGFANQGLCIRMVETGKDSRK